MHSDLFGAFPLLSRGCSQGDPATVVLYVPKGGIKLSVANEVGKEAVVGMLAQGDFIGEGGLAGDWQGKHCEW